MLVCATSGIVEAVATAEILLVRHGETAWSASGRHTGRTDIPLSPAGEAAAAGLRSRLPERPDAVLVSPLQRAAETCRLAGLSATAIVDDDLREWDYGDYEGLTTPEIRATRPGWSLWRDGCPGGEDAAAVGARADRVVARLAAIDSGAAVVFAHGHLLRVLAARWIGLGPEAGALLALDPATVSALGWEREQRVIRRWNA
jgi:broad specificity phosphatase PhoE